MAYLSQIQESPFPLPMVSRVTVAMQGELYDNLALDNGAVRYVQASCARLCAYAQDTWGIVVPECVCEVSRDTVTVSLKASLARRDEFTIVLKAKYTHLTRALCSRLDKWARDHYDILT